MVNNVLNSDNLGSKNKQDSTTQPHDIPFADTDGGIFSDIEEEDCASNSPERRSELVPYEAKCLSVETESQVMKKKSSESVHVPCIDLLMASFVRNAFPDTHASRVVERVTKASKREAQRISCTESRDFDSDTDQQNHHTNGNDEKNTIYTNGEIEVGKIDLSPLSTDSYCIADKSDMHPSNSGTIKTDQQNHHTTGNDETNTTYANGELELGKNDESNSSQLSSDSYCIADKIELYPSNDESNSSQLSSDSYCIADEIELYPSNDESNSSQLSSDSYCIADKIELHPSNSGNIETDQQDNHATVNDENTTCANGTIELVLSSSGFIETDQYNDHATVNDTTNMANANSEIELGRIDSYCILDRIEVHLSSSGNSDKNIGLDSASFESQYYESDAENEDPRYFGGTSMVGLANRGNNSKGILKLNAASTKLYKQTLNQFIIRIKNQAINVLKLSSKNKWHKRLLTVSNEGTWLNSDRSGSSNGKGFFCPHGILFVKNLSRKSKEFSVSRISSRSNKGILLNQMSKVKKENESLKISLSKLQDEFVGSSILRIYRSDKSAGFVTLRCAKADEEDIIAGCNAIIDAFRSKNHYETKAPLF